MKYRKRPLEVEAFQFTKARRQDNSQWPQWLHMAWNRDWDSIGSFQTRVHHTDPFYDESVVLVTPEGVMDVKWNDWIVRGIVHELYPCKPHIFEATYEPITEPAKSDLESPHNPDEST